MRSRARVALLLLLTFAAGAAAGVAGERLWPGTGTAEAEESAAERRGHQTVIERFADDIGLTAEQRATIAPILERSRKRFERLWEGLRPRYEALVDSVRGEIEVVLEPDQVERYRELLRKQEEKERARRDKRDKEGEDSKGDRS
ncbi:MAG: hypothetical protein ACE5JR_10160 [Gemmatimonadota bacterium]